MSSAILDPYPLQMADPLSPSVDIAGNQKAKKVSKGKHRYASPSLGGMFLN
jgi:hypothetical protein